MRRQSVAFFDLSWEWAYIRWFRIFPAPYMPVNDYQSTVSIDFGVTNKF